MTLASGGKSTSCAFESSNITVAHVEFCCQSFGIFTWGKLIFVISVKYSLGYSCRLSRSFSSTVGSQWIVQTSFHLLLLFFWHLRENPLTPVLPVTAGDEPWPFFHFWRHQFWPSSILNFCRRARKRSFQRCLVHSDRLIGAWNMHKNAHKDERKTLRQISCHYT